MSAAIDIARLGASKLVEGTPTWQTDVPDGGGGQVESLGEVDVYAGGPGFASMPWPADETGGAEAVIIRNCGGRDAVCIGGRDTRNADIVGKLGPGDAAMFATGPKGKAVAQVQVKSKKRQVVLGSKDKRRKEILIVLDGENEKIQINGFGHMIEISRANGVSLAEKGGANILLQDGGIYLNGAVHIQGMQPGMVLAQMLPSVQTPGPLANALTPVMGVGK